MKRLNLQKSFVLSIIFILASLIFADIPKKTFGEELPYPGRYLPNGHYLSRNLQAASSDTPIYNPYWPVITDWGPEIYVSDTTRNFFDPRIVIGDTILHVFGPGSFEPIHYKSFNNGDSWQFWANYHDSTMADGHIINAYCEGNRLYATYSGQRGNDHSFVIFRSSTDGGQTWPIISELNSNPSRNGARHSNVSGHRDTAFVSFTEFYNFDSLACWRTTNRGNTWTNRSFIADAWGDSYPPSLCYAAGVVHIAFQKEFNHQDAIFYIRSTDYGQSWSEPLMLDFDDGNHGQFPELWADSLGNVAVCWMDYIGSPYDWTGGIWCRISHDYGVSWQEPIMLNSDYLGWAGTSVVVDGAYMAAAWVSNTTPQNTVHVIESSDGGVSWQNDQLVSEGWSFVPRLAKKESDLYIIWRKIEFVRPDFDVNFIKFMRNDLEVGIASPEGGTEDKQEVGLSVYPNPFNSSTVIEYDLAVPSEVSIGIFDIQGRRVETIEQGCQPAGRHSVIWDAGGQSSGIYFYRLKAGDKTETRKMVLIK